MLLSVIVTVPAPSIDSATDAPPSGASIATMSSADSGDRGGIDVRQPEAGTVNRCACRHVAQPRLVVAAIDARGGIDRDGGIGHVVRAHRAHVHVAALGGVDAVPQGPERGEAWCRHRPRRCRVHRRRTPSGWSPRTPARRRSRSPSPSVPVTVRCERHRAHVGGRGERRRRPGSACPPRRSRPGPTSASRRSTSSGVPPASPTAASSTVAPTSTATSTPALATAGPPPWSWSSPAPWSTSSRWSTWSMSSMSSTRSRSWPPRRRRRDRPRTHPSGEQRHDGRDAGSDRDSATAATRSSLLQMFAQEAERCDDSELSHLLALAGQAGRGAPRRTRARRGRRTAFPPVGRPARSGRRRR